MRRGVFENITRTYDCHRSFTNGAHAQAILESQKRGKGQHLKLTLALREGESPPKCASCFTDGVVNNVKLSAGPFTSISGSESEVFDFKRFD
jgi:hypothetical protein